MIFIYTQKQVRGIVANNIRYFRLKNGWSQEDFAERLQTTFVYVSALENAKKNFRIDYIEHIANTLDIDVKELFIDRPKVGKSKRPRRVIQR